MTSVRLAHAPSPSLTPAEAARELGVSAVSVRRWASSGQLPAVRLGGGELARYRIEREALDAFVRSACPDGEASS
jgi:excisionase family DNA binding protein